MTEKQIRKVLRPEIAFLIIFIICAVIATALIVLGIYRDNNLETPKPVDFAQAVKEGKDKEKLYVESTLIGIMPFAVNGDVEVYLNVSLKRFETIIPACGSSDSAIELTKKELEKYS